MDEIYCPVCDDVVSPGNADRDDYGRLVHHAHDESFVHQVIVRPVQEQP